MKQLGRTVVFLLSVCCLVLGAATAASASEESNGGLGANSNYKSVYTPLIGEYCITVSQWSPGMEKECPGMAGYRVLLFEDDARQSITLVKDGEQYPLNFWDSVTPYFGTLGNLIEWRVYIETKIVDVDEQRGELIPVALIVRVNSEGERKESSLAVIDMLRENKCVVSVVPQGKEQNEKAREIADRAAKMECIGNR